MSLAQEPYIPPHAHPTGTSVMDLNNLLHSQRPVYDRYTQPTQEGAAQAQPQQQQQQQQSQQQQSPQMQLPTQQSTPNEPQVVSTVFEGRLYSLDIVQQPVRARMCGFGDKDRRPITSPPCIRLMVRDAQTKQEIDINDIDTSYFVLSVDLWSADATKEVNLVRHSATSPSISAATSASYPPNTNPQGSFSQGVTPQYGDIYQQSPISPHHYQTGMVSMGMHQPLYASSYGQSTYPKQSELAQYQQAYKHQELQQHQQHQHQSSHHHHLPSSQPPTSLPPPQSMTEQIRGYYTAGPSPATPSTPMGYYSHQGPLLSPDQIPPSTDPRAQPGGMFTRNLIGSLCVSAFKLTDPDNKVGVWFVLQDLSVRTEGTFRLKLNFVNVGQTPSSAPTTPSSSSHPHHQTFPPLSSSSINNPSTSPYPTGIGKLNTGSAPVLASCFSDSFEVFSAKKFPGVIESTKLSKCFATQGIKIPIRKDGVRGDERGRVGKEEEGEEED